MCITVVSEVLQVSPLSVSKELERSNRGEGGLEMNEDFGQVDWRLKAKGNVDSFLATG